MFDVVFSAAYDRTYRKLPVQIQQKVDSTIQQLRINPHHPSLRTHKRQGEGQTWQARVTRSYRLFFLMEGETIVLLEVRPHEK